MIKLFEDCDKIYYPDYRRLVFDYVDDLDIRMRLLQNNNETLTDIGYLSRKQRKELYKYTFSIFEEELNKVIDNHLEIIKDHYEDNVNKLPQTFLSYSYSDKGITFILFFYFLANGGYLHIDWMHSPAYPNGVAIKDSLNDALLASDNFLFLYTFNSEIRDDSTDRRSFKEWCSWEFGSFYRSHHAKFYLRLPNNYDDYKVPDILDTFKELELVRNGVLTGHMRALNMFYAPNEQSAATIALTLLSEYVHPKYESFDLEPELQSFVRYDAYSKVYKTALEFSMVMDSSKKDIKKEFKFRLNDEFIDNHEKSIYPRLREFLSRKVQQINRFDVNTELIVLLPTRYISSLNEEQLLMIINLINENRSNRLKKVYLVFINAIYELMLGGTNRKKPYRIHYYKEEDK